MSETEILGPLIQLLLMLGLAIFLSCIWYKQGRDDAEAEIKDLQEVIERLTRKH